MQKMNEAKLSFPIRDWACLRLQLPSEIYFSRALRTVRHFDFDRDFVLVCASQVTPRNSRYCVGTRTDLLKLIIHSRCCITVIANGTCSRSISED